MVCFYTPLISRKRDLSSPGVVPPLGVDYKIIIWNIRRKINFFY